jgi:hypothetical protein
LLRRCAALPAALSVLFIWTTDVQAQCAGSSCVVTTNADTLAGGSTSLRDAITYSNANPGTAITFAISNQTITLTSELPLVLGNNTTINGGANNVTLSGNNAFRGFFIGDAGQTGNGPTKWTNGWSAAGTFEGEFSNVTRSYAGKGVVRYAW